MPNTIKIKRGVGEPLPTALVVGELAIDTTTGELYSKLDDATVTKVVTKASNISIIARNETGSPIPAGKAVYINGASGNKATITLAQANSEPSSTKTVGLTAKQINNNNNGEVVIFGTISKIDTLAYTEGTKLWLSPTSAGELTSTIPSAPNHAVFIGDVVRSHQTQGQIEVRIQNGFELEELHNVSITSVANNNILSYESSTGLWKNKTASQLGLATLASPALTGTPTAPTQTTATSGSAIANLSYVYNAISAYSSSSAPIFSTILADTVSPTTLVLQNNGVYLVAVSDNTTYANLIIDGGSPTFPSGSKATIIQMNDSLNRTSYPNGGKIIVNVNGLSNDFRWDDKFMSSGVGSVVNIVKAGSLFIEGDLSYLPSGYPTYDGCTTVTLTDFIGTVWSGDYAHRTQTANGDGTRTNLDAENSNGCWHPFGFSYNQEQINTLSITWDAYDYGGSIIQSGTINYSYDTVSDYADGNGGNVYAAAPFNMPDGTIIYEDNFYDSVGQETIYYRIIYNTPASYTQVNQNYPF